MLLELAGDTVVRRTRAAVAVDKTAVRNGAPLTIVVDGRPIEYAFERIVQAGDAVTWVGRNSADERVFVTLSPGASYVALQAHGRQVHIASERNNLRITRGKAPQAFSKQTGYRKHRRALALASLQPASIQEDAKSGLIRRIRGKSLGHVINDEFVPSDDFREALALDHDLDLRATRHGSGAMTSKYAYKTFHQHLHGVRVSSPVRIIYSSHTLEVSGVISPIFSAENAPAPAPDDIDAGNAERLALQELATQLGEEGEIEAAAELVYGELDGELNLLWVIKVRHRDAPYVAFVNAKSGTATIRSTALPTHTCTANGTGAAQCTDVQATLVIGSNGQCLNSCGSPMEAAHRESIRLYEEAIARYRQIGYAGGANSFDPDVEIVTDSAALPNDAAGIVRVASDFEAQIILRDVNAASNPRVMYHEAAHVYVIGKNPIFDPDVPGYTPGMHSLHESIAYILGEISRGSTAGLNHPSAHINGYVDNFASARSNAMILEQAFYKWITTPNSTNIQMAEKILLRATMLIGSCSGGVNCLYNNLRDAVADVLDMMDDSDEITGPQETPIKNDFYVAMGSVGLGHLAQPPGGGGTPPPPPPAPSTPVVAQQFLQCVGGDTWYTLWWNTVAHADTYRAYIDFENFRGSVDSPPGLYGPVNGYNPNLHLHACGPGGCSWHSNSVPVYDVCE